MGYGVRCVRWGLDLCHFPAKKGVVPMHGYRNVTPNPNFTIFLFPDTFWVKPYHTANKRGVENSPPKDLVRGPVCWAKMVHFWKPWKHAFWPSPDCKWHFILPKEVQNRTFTQDHRTITKMSPILLQTPLVSWWYREGAFGNPLSDRDFHPFPPCPPGHFPPQTECAGVLGCI